MIFDNTTDPFLTEDDDLTRMEDEEPVEGDSFNDDDELEEDDFEDDTEEDDLEDDTESDDLSEEE